MSRGRLESKGLPARWGGGAFKEPPVQRGRKDLSEIRDRKGFKEPPAQRESRDRKDFRVRGLMGL